MIIIEIFHTFKILKLTTGFLKELFQVQTQSCGGEEEVQRMIQQAIQKETAEQKERERKKKEKGEAERETDCRKREREAERQMQT